MWCTSGSPPWTSGSAIWKRPPRETFPPPASRWRPGPTPKCNMGSRTHRISNQHRIINIAKAPVVQVYPHDRRFWFYFMESFVLKMTSDIRISNPHGTNSFILVNLHVHLYLYRFRITVHTSEHLATIELVNS